jgi:hypothetical protein
MSKLPMYEMLYGTCEELCNLRFKKQIKSCTYWKTRSLENMPPHSNRCEVYSLLEKNWDCIT